MKLADWTWVNFFVDAYTHTHTQILNHYSFTNKSACLQSFLFNYRQSQIYIICAAEILHGYIIIYIYIYTTKQRRTATSCSQACWIVILVLLAFSGLNSGREGIPLRLQFIAKQMPATRYPEERLPVNTWLCSITLIIFWYSTSSQLTATSPKSSASLLLNCVPHQSIWTVTKRIFTVAFGRY